MYCSSKSLGKVVVLTKSRTRALVGIQYTLSIVLNPWKSILHLYVTSINWKKRLLPMICLYWKTSSGQLTTGEPNWIKIISSWSETTHLLYTFAQKGIKKWWSIANGAALADYHTWVYRRIALKHFLCMASCI